MRNTLNNKGISVGYYNKGNETNMGSNYTPTDNSEKAKINRMYSGQKASSKKRNRIDKINWKSSWL